MFVIFSPLAVISGDVRTPSPLPDVPANRPLKDPFTLPLIPKAAASFMPEVRALRSRSFAARSTVTAGAPFSSAVPVPERVPPPKEAIPDAMNKLFELMKSEPEASVRAVLGHYIFGFIHPYFDGNGRIARFIMNLMFVTGGFNWTVVRVEKRKEYMDALETCSRENTIANFTKVIVSEMNYWKENAPTLQKVDHHS